MPAPEEWCKAVGTTLEQELHRYDAVLFFQSAALGNRPINATMLEGGNAVRSESQDEAKNLDRKLFDVWSAHPNFHLIPSRDSFFEKIQESVTVFAKILTELEQKNGYSHHHDESTDK